MSQIKAVVQLVLFEFFDHQHNSDQVLELYLDTLQLSKGFLRILKEFLLDHICDKIYIIQLMYNLLEKVSFYPKQEKPETK